MQRKIIILLLVVATFLILLTFLVNQRLKKDEMFVPSFQRGQALEKQQAETQKTSQVYRSILPLSSKSQTRKEGQAAKEKVSQSEPQDLDTVKIEISEPPLSHQEPLLN